MYELINKVKEINPLVVHYTNEVTINDCANVTLALGASPLMSYSYEEVEEVIGISSAVVTHLQGGRGQPEDRGPRQDLLLCGQRHRRLPQGAGRLLGRPRQRQL